MLRLLIVAFPLVVALVPARLPSYADNIMRLQDTEPESLEIMLRLLLVALQLDFALPAALDEQEANAIQFEVQTTLHFEVRSPSESRPLLPAAARNQHTTAHSSTHAQHPSARIAMHALRH